MTKKPKPTEPPVADPERTPPEPDTQAAAAEQVEPCSAKLQVLAIGTANLAGNKTAKVLECRKTPAVDGLGSFRIPYQGADADAIRKGDVIAITVDTKPPED
jgi:hypothetical protein